MLPRPIIAITLMVALISQDVSGQNVTNSTSILSPTTSIFSTVTNQPTTSTASLSQTATTTTIQTQTATTTTIQTQTETTTTSKTISPTGSTPGGSSMVPTASSPADLTCGVVTFVWDKPWNDSYKGNHQFAGQVTKALKRTLEAYIHVNVSDLNVQQEKEDIRVKFKLCLVHSYKESYLVDELKKLLGELDNNTITGLKFEASGVKFKDWKAKDGECEKCSKGAGGPFIIEGKCEPEDKYSCNGLKTTKESLDCPEYCSASSASVQKMSTFILVLGIILAFSVNFWK